MPDSITFTGDISGSMTLLSDQLYQNILDGKIKVENPYNPITYIGDINSTVNLEATELDPTMTTQVILGTTNIEKDIFTDELLSGEITIDKNTFDRVIHGLTNIENETLDISLDGEVELTYSDQYKKHLSGNLLVESDKSEKDLNGHLWVVNDKEDKEILSGELEYEEGTYTHDIDCDVTLTLFNSWVDLASHVRVPCGRYIYSIFSKMRVVPGYNMDLISSINVTDDGHYDIIRGNLNIDKEDHNTDVLDGEVELEKYETTTIDGSVSINRVDTRFDLFSELYAAEGKTIDIHSFMNVEPTPYRYGYVDILSHINAGFESINDLFTGTLVAYQPERISVDIDCSVEVKPSKENLIRIGIFVDPLWKMEPYVLKGALTTLFDPIYHKERVKVVYGGNARALYMIKHFCEVYHVLHSIPLKVDYTQNPIVNMHMVHGYTRALLDIPDKEHEYLDRVFIFANTSGQHGGSMLHPLLHHLSELNIETYVIDSSGNYLGLDTRNSTLIPLGTAPTSTYHYNPLHHIPVGMATKHRMIFDKNPVV